MRILLAILLCIGLLPISLSAKKVGILKDVPVNSKHLIAVNDSIPYQKQDDKKEKNKESKQDTKQVGKDVEPEIKQVPKARRQAKPTVIKPVIKVKPIKIVRPKIKKP